jgi:hypothetical protein
MQLSDLLAVFNIVAALVSAGTMFYASRHEKHGRALYVILGALCVYYAGAYAYLVIWSPPLGSLSSMLIRSPQSLLLMAITILYIMRDIKWMPPSSLR